MSVITLNFGQCGNQIAQTLYSTLYEDLKPKSNLECDHTRWFNVTKRNIWKPRAILVDTETKVTEEINQNLPFNFNNIVAKSFGGSANNWAFGYTKRSRVLVDEILEKTRKEVENCDFLTSFLSINSSSGGTGSGISCYVLEKIRTEFCKKNIASSVVLPFVHGEIAVQNYNTVLHLSHLYNIVDSIILFENERLHHLCKYTLNNENIKFSNLNSIISKQLLSIYLPIVDVRSSPINTTNTVCILNNLTANRDYKFLQIRTEPHFQKASNPFGNINLNWNSLIQGVQKQSRFDLIEQRNSSLQQKIIANTVITRSGNTSNKCTADHVKMLNMSKDYVDWVPKDHTFNCYNSSKQFLNFEKFFTLISNSNSVCTPLDLVLEDSWGNFIHGAYLHHYDKYGVDTEYFLNAFQYLENVLSSYQNL